MPSLLAPPRAVPPRSLAALRLLAVSGACTVLGVLLTLPGITEDQGYLTFLVVVVVASVGASPLVAAVCAGLAWAIFTGFVANGYGTLTATGDDLVRLGLYLGAAVMTAVFSAAGRGGAPTHP